MPPGTVIRSFAAPAADTSDITWDGRTLWVLDIGTDRVYQVDPVTGTVLRSFATPSTVPRGLTWDGRMLWMSNEGSSRIYQIDPTTGTVIRSFATVGVEKGLAWDGKALWMVDSFNDLINQIDPNTGTVLRSIAAPGGGNGARGLTWDGASLWFANLTSDRIYQINPVSGTVIRSFPAPVTSPQGLAWDGRTLWHTDRGTDLIYQLSVTPGASYADRILATGPIGYWPQWEAAGTISFDISGNSPLSERDGAYTGVTLAQPGIGDGRTSALYDGANDYDDIFSASFASAFNGSEGTALIWFQVLNAGVWADGLFRDAVAIRVDGNNYVRLYKHTDANALITEYAAGGVIDFVYEGGLVSTSSFPIGCTWSAAADEFRFYINGAQVGATQNGLGVWAGVPANTLTVIGAVDTVPSQPTNGYLAHGVIWDRALTPAEMLSLGVL